MVLNQHFFYNNITNTTTTRRPGLTNASSTITSTVLKWRRYFRHTTSRRLSQHRILRYFVGLGLKYSGSRSQYSTFVSRAQLPPQDLAMGSRVDRNTSPTSAQSFSSPIPPSSIGSDHGWKYSWCCECNAWYAAPNLQGGVCVRGPCRHILCVDCKVSKSSSRNARRVAVGEAEGILKSICCNCESEHVGTVFINTHCDEDCEHSFCGECHVYRDSEMAALEADVADIDLSICCKCTTYHGESLKLRGDGRCADPDCKHRICENCTLRMKKRDGRWGTMRVKAARLLRLLR